MAFINLIVIRIEIQQAHTYHMLIEKNKQPQLNAYDDCNMPYNRRLNNLENGNGKRLIINDFLHFHTHYTSIAHIFLLQQAIKHFFSTASTFIPPH
jgi:hypothetical protein